MSNESQQNRRFIVTEEVLNNVLNLLGELPLKNSLNIYLQLQQSAVPLDKWLADQEESKGKKE